MDLSERHTVTGSRHPWERARSSFVRRLLEPALPRTPLRLLDAGAGDAWLVHQVLADLPAGSTATCWDIEYTPEIEAELRSGGPSAISYTAEEPKEDFDVILALDVIEHVEDDGGFLKTLRSRAASGATLLVTVPAWPQLFTRHDAALGHHRRYRPAELRRVVEDAGFTVQARGGLFHSLLPVRALQALVQRVRRPATESEAESDLGQWNGGPALTSIFTGVLNLDLALTLAFVSNGWSLPGLSCWVLCKAEAGPHG